MEDNSGDVGNELYVPLSMSDPSERRLSKQMEELKEELKEEIREILRLLLEIFNKNSSNSAESKKQGSKLSESGSFEEELPEPTHNDGKRFLFWPFVNENYLNPITKQEEQDTKAAKHLDKYETLQLVAENLQQLPVCSKQEEEIKAANHLDRVEILRKTLHEFNLQFASEEALDEIEDIPKLPYIHYQAEIATTDHELGSEVEERIWLPTEEVPPEIGEILSSSEMFRYTDEEFGMEKNLDSARTTFGGEVGYDDDSGNLESDFLQTKGIESSCSTDQDSQHEKVQAFKENEIKNGVETDHLQNTNQPPAESCIKTDIDSHTSLHGGDPSVEIPGGRFEIHQYSNDFQLGIEDSQSATSQTINELSLKSDTIETPNSIYTQEPENGTKNAVIFHNSTNDMYTYEKSDESAEEFNKIDSDKILPSPHLFKFSIESSENLCEHHASDLQTEKTNSQDLEFRAERNKHFVCDDSSDRTEPCGSENVAAKHYSTGDTDFNKIENVTSDQLMEENAKEDINQDFQMKQGYREKAVENVVGHEQFSNKCMNDITHTAAMCEKSVNETLTIGKNPRALETCKQNKWADDDIALQEASIEQSLDEFSDDGMNMLEKHSESFKESFTEENGTKSAAKVETSIIEGNSKSGLHDSISRLQECSYIQKHYDVPTIEIKHVRKGLSNNKKEDEVYLQGNDRNFSILHESANEIMSDVDNSKDVIKASCKDYLDRADYTKACARDGIIESNVTNDSRCEWMGKHTANEIESKPLEQLEIEPKNDAMKLHEKNLEAGEELPFQGDCDKLNSGLEALPSRSHQTVENCESRLEPLELNHSLMQLKKSGIEENLEGAEHFLSQDRMENEKNTFAGNYSNEVPATYKESDAKQKNTNMSTDEKMKSIAEHVCSPKPTCMCDSSLCTCSLLVSCNSVCETRRDFNLTGCCDGRPKTQIPSKVEVQLDAKSTPLNKECAVSAEVPNDCWQRAKASEDIIVKAVKDVQENGELLLSETATSSMEVCQQLALETQGSIQHRQNKTDEKEDMGQDVHTVSSLKQDNVDEIKPELNNLMGFPISDRGDGCKEELENPTVGLDKVDFCEEIYSDKFQNDKKNTANKEDHSHAFEYEDPELTNIDNPPLDAPSQVEQRINPANKQQDEDALHSHKYQHKSAELQSDKVLFHGDESEYESENKQNFKIAMIDGNFAKTVCLQTNRSTNGLQVDGKISYHKKNETEIIDIYNGHEKASVPHSEDVNKVSKSEILSNAEKLLEQTRNDRMSTVFGQVVNKNNLKQITKQEKRDIKAAKHLDTHETLELAHENNLQQLAISPKQEEETKAENHLDKPETLRKTSDESCLEYASEKAVDEIEEISKSSDILDQVEIEKKDYDLGSEVEERICVSTDISSTEESQSSSEMFRCKDEELGMEKNLDFAVTTFTGKVGYDDDSGNLESDFIQTKGIESSCSTYEDSQHEKVQAFNENEIKNDVETDHLQNTNQPPAESCIKTDIDSDTSLCRGDPPVEIPDGRCEIQRYGIDFQLGNEDSQSTTRQKINELSIKCDTIETANSICTQEPEKEMKKVIFHRSTHDMYTYEGSDESAEELKEIASDKTTGSPNLPKLSIERSKSVCENMKCASDLQSEKAINHDLKFRADSNKCLICDDSSDRTEPCGSENVAAKQYSTGDTDFNKIENVTSDQLMEENAKEDINQDFQMKQGYREKAVENVVGHEQFSDKCMNDITHTTAICEKSVNETLSIGKKPRALETCKQNKWADDDIALQEASIEQSLDEFSGDSMNMLEKHSESFKESFTEENGTKSAAKVETSIIEGNSKSDLHDSISRLQECSYIQKHYDVPTIKIKHVRKGLSNNKKEEDEVYLQGNDRNFSILHESADEIMSDVDNSKGVINASCKEYPDRADYTKACTRDGIIESNVTDDSRCEWMGKYTANEIESKPLEQLEIEPKNDAMKLHEKNLEAGEELPFQGDCDKLNSGLEALLSRSHQTVENCESKLEPLELNHCLTQLKKSGIEENLEEHFLSQDRMENEKNTFAGNYSNEVPATYKESDAKQKNTNMSTDEKMKSIAEHVCSPKPTCMCDSSLCTCTCNLLVSCNSVCETRRDFNLTGCCDGRLKTQIPSKVEFQLDAKSTPLNKECAVSAEVPNDCWQRAKASEDIIVKAVKDIQENGELLLSETATSSVEVCQQLALETQGSIQHRQNKTDEKEDMGQDVHTVSSLKQDNVDEIKPELNNLMGFPISDRGDGCKEELENPTVGLDKVDFCEEIYSNKFQNDKKNTANEDHSHAFEYEDPELTNIDYPPLDVPSQVEQRINPANKQDEDALHSHKYQHKSAELQSDKVLFHGDESEYESENKQNIKVAIKDGNFDKTICLQTNYTTDRLQIGDENHIIVKSSNCRKNLETEIIDLYNEHKIASVPHFEEDLPSEYINKDTCTTLVLLLIHSFNADVFFLYAVLVNKHGIYTTEYASKEPTSFQKPHVGLTYLDDTVYIDIHRKSSRHTKSSLLLQSGCRNKCLLYRSKIIDVAVKKYFCTFPKTHPFHSFSPHGNEMIPAVPSTLESGQMGSRTSRYRLKPSTSLKTLLMWLFHNVAKCNSIDIAQILNAKTFKVNVFIAKMLDDIVKGKWAMYSLAVSTHKSGITFNHEFSISSCYDDDVVDCKNDVGKEQLVTPAIQDKFGHRNRACCQVLPVLRTCFVSCNVCKVTKPLHVLQRSKLFESYQIDTPIMQLEIHDRAR